MPRCEIGDADISENASSRLDTHYEKRITTYTEWRGEVLVEELAEAGFVYTGTRDQVVCRFCQLQISKWTKDANPLQLHRKYTPNCPFVVGTVQQKMPSVQILHTDKHPGYSNLQSRLNSFTAWPLTWVAHTPEMMARSGFFYTGSADRVTCFSCGVTLRDWRDEDYPPSRHRNDSEDCRFVAKLDILGIKHEIDELRQLMIEYDDYNATEIFNPRSPTDISFIVEGVRGNISSTRIVKDNESESQSPPYASCDQESGLENSTDSYPEYSDPQSRLDSFTAWPLTWVAHTPEMMVRSGFFYTGSADRVTCFSCGVTLRDWRDEDYPPSRHRNDSEDCRFVAKLDILGIKHEIDELRQLMIEYDDYNATEIFNPRSPTDIERLQQDINELKQLLVEFDDYNFTEIFNPKSTTEIVSIAEGVHDYSPNELPAESRLNCTADGSDRYPEYANVQRRLNSFTAWPLTWVAHTPEMMARSGFFYTGSADRVTCFSCGVTLRDWRDEDYPPCLHRMISEDCRFVTELDIDSIKQDIDELEQLLVDYDDYNFTEIVNKKSSGESILTEDGVCCDFSRSNFVGCCPASQ